MAPPTDGQVGAAQVVLYGELLRVERQLRCIEYDLASMPENGARAYDNAAYDVAQARNSVGEAIKDMVHTRRHHTDAVAAAAPDPVPATAPEGEGA